MKTAFRYCAVLGALLGAIGPAKTGLAKDLEKAPAASVGMAQDKLDALKAAMQGLINDGHRSGIVYAIAHKDKMIALEALGSRDLEHNLPMQTDTLFRLASLSRVLSGATILSLIDEGKLKLTDPVSKYIPEFGSTQVIKSVEGDRVTTEPQKTPLTIRHLFTYTGGFGYGPDWPKSLGLKQSEIFDLNAPIGDGIRKLASYPLLTQPGAKWHYGFSGDILGRVAEVASGQRLDDFLRSHMFDKIGMKDTAFYAKDPSRLAEVYNVDKSGKLINVSESVSHLSNFMAPGPMMSAGGGLVSSVPDYLRFAQMLVNGGKLDGVQVLKPETVRAMLTRQTTPEQGMTYWYDPDRYQSVKGYAWGYAIGVRVDGVEHQMPGSTGDAGWAGFTNTWFFVDPKNEIAGVAMSQYIGPDDGAPVLKTLRQGIYDAIAAAK